MPRPKKPVDPRWAPVPDAVLDHFAPPGILDAADVEAATQRFKKALLERALGAELQHHLTQEAGTAPPEAPANHRNGTSAKTVLTDAGAVPLAIPRDRQGTFAPVLIPTHARRFTGFDDKIIALYARGLSVREIQAFLTEMYAVDVSPDLISTVTDAVLSEVTAWQARPLETMYPVVFFDALRVKVRDEAVVHTKAIYLALAVLPDGTRDILGVWIEQTEGAKFWMKVFADLQTRGVRDILIAVTDGLKGMPEALAAVYPATTLQTCVVHLIRHSLDYTTWKTRKLVAAALRPIYTAPTGGGRGHRARRLRRRPVGAPISDGRRVLAACLAAGHTVLRVSPGDPPRALHDQCARKRQPSIAENAEDPRTLSQRRRRDQTDLAGPAEHHGHLEAARAYVEGRDEPIRHPL